MSSQFSEDALVEQPAIALFAGLGWETENCFYEKFGENSSHGRETSSEVVLLPQLRSALEGLNPALSKEAIELAIEELVRDRSIMSPANANREIYQLLKNGVKVSFQDSENEEIVETVQVIDWNEPLNNNFFLASQFWISGDMYKRRADLVGFVNGLPLIFIELKASHRRLEHAYQDNLRDNKSTIPQLFWYNSLSAGQMSISIIFPDSVFKNLIIFIFYKYVLFMDKITVFLRLELLELIFHGNCWKRPHFETFKLMK